MKLLLAFSALIVLCGLTSAYRINGNTIEKGERVIYGRRSEKGDDAASVAACPRGYQVYSCSCGRFGLDTQPCDGVWVGQSDGSSCTALNSAWGRGVSAVSRCFKLLTIENNSGPMYLDAPKVRCPPGYKVIDCNLHTGYRHKLDGPAKSEIVGNVCKSTPNCRHCRIQARCMAEVEKWDPGHLTDDVWGKQCLDTPNAGTTTAGVAELYEDSRANTVS